MSRNLVFLRRQMYMLKREYGFPAAIYRITPGNTNLETGGKNVTRVKYAINRVIVLPSNANSLGFYPAQFLKAGREFAYGGYQNLDLKFFLFDAADLPVVIEETDSIVYQHKKFEIVNLQQVEYDLGYLATAKYLKGEAPYEVHEASLFQSVRFVQRSANA